MLLPLALVLPASRVEKILLALTSLLVVLVEILNTAIETAIDRISEDRHPLSGRAKDLGSAAVFISLVIWFVTWAAIVGPILLRFVGL